MSPSVYVLGAQVGGQEGFSPMGFGSGVGFGSSAKDLPEGLSGVDPGYSSSLRGGN